MGMMLKNLIHPYIQSTTVLCDIMAGWNSEVCEVQTLAIAIYVITDAVV